MTSTALTGVAGGLTPSRRGPASLEAEGERADEEVWELGMQEQGALERYLYRGSQRQKEWSD